jgi:alkaline phosphatase
MPQHPRQPLALALALALGLSATAVHAVTSVAGPGNVTLDPGRVPATRFFPTGSVIFFHPDGAGLEHWNAARMFFLGPDRSLNFDRLPFMAVYRGHMEDGLTASSNGAATTHAFGHRVASAGSFGKDGDAAARPATDRFIDSLSGYPGSIMREAAAAGLPVGVINDGHVAEPGSGAFLAEVGNRGLRQEILRQMVQGRPGANDPTPWVILGGGEADLRPAGAALVHRNHNRERGAALNAQTSLRADAIDLARDWDDNGANPVPEGTLAEKLAARDDHLVILTRADLDALRATLQADAGYAPRVLGLFAYQDLMNDRGEEELVAGGKRRNDAACLSGTQPVRVVGPAPLKQSCLVLFGDQDPLQPGANPPTFAEMTQLAILILDRAARQQSNANARRFLLVAESEAVDNFGNAGNAIGMLQSIRDTDDAIGVAQSYLRQNPRTLILTAADSDAGSMAVASPPGFVGCNSAPPNIVPIRPWPRS